MNITIIGKLSKLIVSEVCIKLVALRINWYPRSSSEFHKGWWPVVWGAGTVFPHFLKSSLI